MTITILCDSREQSPLDFSTYKEVSVTVAGLPFGDYTATLDGAPALVAFERKTVGDLWGTMTSGYERFRREILKAKDAGHKLILVTECTYSDVAHGFDRSQFSGDSMLKKLHTLCVKYGLEWFPCDSRKSMAHHIVSTFLAISRYQAKELLDTCQPMNIMKPL